MNLTTDTGSVSQNDMDPDAALDLRVGSELAGKTIDFPLRPFSDTYVRQKI